MHCKHLNLNVEVDVLTTGALADIVNAILESLLFQRHQIPLVYKTYRYYVRKWSEEENELSEENVTSTTEFLRRQKENATKTNSSISAMKELVRKAFKNKCIKSLRFLFGSTTYTPKEAYTIHIPTEEISSNHSHEQHPMTIGNLNQTLLSLLTHPDLYTIFSSNLNPTNIYLELEISKQIIDLKTMSNAKVDIIPKEFCTLPPSCKDVQIHLLHTGNTSSSSLHCCKDLQVYKDFMDLHLEDNAATIEADSDSNKCKNILYKTNEWWEADIYIRGFKEQGSKCLNMWS
ncbi:uncharacterized protein ACN427_008058 [Glossina fuscipes fuscipes]|uniref:MAD2L1-binding protein n=1 Tax=Glossina palpalis gambiensis TaxID=67801 RepID=A0A1B0B2Z5_9MUSC